jgi:hypothetical protein
MARCETCGAELQDASQRFCGGDRCDRVFMNHPRPGTPGSPPASQRASPDLPQARLTAFAAARARIAGRRRVAELSRGGTR